MENGRVLMIQQGARRNYIYAQQLHAAGLLYRLAVDAAWHQDGKGMLNRLLKKYAPRRQVCGVGHGQILSSIYPNIAELSKQFIHEERAFLLSESAMSSFLEKNLEFDNFDVVINYLGNGGAFLNSTKSAGKVVATDFIITPRYLEIEFEERARWPNWDTSRVSGSIISAYAEKIDHLIAISDFYLCPSESVARDLSTFSTFDATKVRLTPYGVSGVLLHEPRTQPGRILFVGQADLRKGIPYLAEAARILSARCPEIEIVVAGAVSDIVRNRPETAALKFLGKLDRVAMAEEYSRADIFCLPSLAEGSAVSVFEAMANGLPVIVTPSAGSVAEHGREGLIVHERSGRAIADAIEQIYRDRDLRQQMASLARQTAAAYDDEKCGKRFLAVVREALTLAARAPKARAAQQG